MDAQLQRVHDVMSNPILVGIDGSPQGDKAFSHALNLAHQADAALHACAVVYGADIEMAEASEREALVERRRSRLHQHIDRLAAQAADTGTTVHTHVLEGQPVEQLLGLASQLQIGHIVVGHRSKGLFEQLLMGSVAKRVVDFARCNVTVVR